MEARGQLRGLAPLGSICSRQRPTKAMTVGPRPSEAATAADQLGGLGGPKVGPRSTQASAQVQSWLTKVRVRSKNIKFGLKWVENPRSGLKLGPEACQDRSGAFGMGLTHSKEPSPAWSWRSKSGPQYRFGPKSSKMGRNGSRIDRLARNKDQMNPTAPPDPSGPLLRPKTDKQLTF